MATQARFAARMWNPDRLPKNETGASLAPVCGEILTFDGPAIPLPAIDQLEEFHLGSPCLYRRVLVPGPVTCPETRTSTSRSKPIIRSIVKRFRLILTSFPFFPDYARILTKKLDRFPGGRSLSTGNGFETMFDQAIDPSCFYLLDDITNVTIFGSV